jgi:DNA-3-methyladenine glycosylase II
MKRRKTVLPAVAPFRLDYTVWALRRRNTNLIDRWEGGRYFRVLVFDNQPVGVVVVQEGTSHDPNLGVTLQCQKAITTQTEADSLSAIRKMLGLAVDLRPFYRLAAETAPLGELVDQFSGVKPPRFPSLFEALVNSIACQQLTLDVGILLINRLAERFGLGFAMGGAVQHAFPRPEDLENAAEADIKKLGYSARKAQAIKELAQTFLQRNDELIRLEKMANEEIVGYLTTLRGIGRWSAEYVLLRGLGRLDVFPGDDVGARNNLRRLFHLPDSPDYAEINRLTSRWHPYEGMVYFHLLLEKLRGKGMV